MGLPDAPPCSRMVLDRAESGLGNQNQLPRMSATLKQLVGSGGLGQRYTVRHHGPDLARCQVIEELRECVAVPPAVRLGVVPHRGAPRCTLAVGNQPEQKHHQHAGQSDTQSLLIDGGRAQPHQPPALA